MIIEIKVNCYLKNLHISNKVVIIIINEYSNLYEQDIVFTKWVNRINEILMKCINLKLYCIYVFSLHNCFTL